MWPPGRGESPHFGWALLIFVDSTDTFSEATTSRLVLPVLHLLLRQADSATLEWLEFLIARLRILQNTSFLASCCCAQPRRLDSNWAREISDDSRISRTGRAVSASLRT